MREYAKVGPKMWHGKTIKELRKKAEARGSEGASRASEGVIVCLYLMTSPSSNMLGLFTQPLLYMAHETGLGEQGALKGLQDCIDVGFCSYDRESEVVWVHEMAKYQIASELKASDNRCAGIQKDFNALPDNPFLAAFFEKYQGAFHLTSGRGGEAPPKPLRSQEQEQEQEKEGGASKAPSKKTKSESLDLGFVLPDWVPADAWDGYVAMRKKKPMTDRARDLVIAELSRLRDQGHDVGAILDKSVKNNWTDVYAPKPNDHRGATPSADDLYRGAR